MSSFPNDSGAAENGFHELNESVAEARDALLRFADARGALISLVCAETEPDCRYHDLAGVRREASVDELLRLVAGIPESLSEAEDVDETGLYPTLLELAEAFDIVIDQHSLVFGDAAALAEPLATEWHAMAGCQNHSAPPAETALVEKRLTANVAALAGVLQSVEALPAGQRREAAVRFERLDGLPWTAEARHLALHCLDTWLPRGISNPEVRKLLQYAREHRTEASGGDPLQRAVADLLLARLVRGLASDPVTDALREPFVRMVPPA